MRVNAAVLLSVVKRNSSNGNQPSPVRGVPKMFVLPSRARAAAATTAGSIEASAGSCSACSAVNTPPFARANATSRLAACSYVISRSFAQAGGQPSSDVIQRNGESPIPSGAVRPSATARSS